MKTKVTLVLISIIAGLFVGYVVGNAVKSDGLETAQREAFLGGVLTFCATVENAGGGRTFTDTECESLGRSTLQQKYFEQWQSAQKP